MEENHPNSNKGVFSRFTKGISSLFGTSSEEEQVDELKQLVTEGQEKGIIEDEEAEMIKNIFDFSDKEVSDIMTHRRNVVAVDVKLSISEAASMMLAEQFSRFPVYENDIDNIVGILHVKDVLRALISKEEHSSIRDIMREPYFVPDTKNIDDLFREMRQKKMHMAIVIDEYGQMDGIVAMEDILEEIVGNIFDEYDLVEKMITKKDEKTFVIKGMAPLDEIEAALDISFGENDFDTLNGLLISEFGHIPSEDEKSEILLAGYIFKVVSVENNMIKEIMAVRQAIIEDTEE